MLRQRLELCPQKASSSPFQAAKQAVRGEEGQKDRMPVEQRKDCADKLPRQKNTRERIAQLSRTSVPLLPDAVADLIADCAVGAGGEDIVQHFLFLGAQLFSAE